jgi:hypothetical protein
MAGSGDSVTGPAEPGGRGPVVLDGMRVLRLCSVFEPAALSGRPAGYDAIGGMHNHAAGLSRQLDRMGAVQLVLTSRLDGPAGRAGFGRGGQVARTGVDTRLARQGRALLAAPLALGGIPADVVHGHCGEDIAVLRWPGWRPGGTTAPWSLPCTPACGTTCGSPRRAPRGCGWPAGWPNAGRWPPRTW